MNKSSEGSGGSPGFLGSYTTIEAEIRSQPTKGSVPIALGKCYFYPNLYSDQPVEVFISLFKGKK